MVIFLAAILVFYLKEAIPLKKEVDEWKKATALARKIQAKQQSTDGGIENGAPVARDDHDEEDESKDAGITNHDGEHEII